VLARRVWVVVGFASQIQAVLVFEDDEAEPPRKPLRCFCWRKPLSIWATTCCWLRGSSASRSMSCCQREAGPVLLLRDLEALLPISSSELTPSTVEMRSMVLRVGCCFLRFS
jgi:hypothetical protein